MTATAVPAVFSSTPGLSDGQWNEELFSRGYLSRIEWIREYRDGTTATITLAPLARRPKQEGEQFAPTFTTEEVLTIAEAQMPRPQSFQNCDVYLDGIIPVALALRLSHLGRYARSLHVNVPREGGWKKVFERPPAMPYLSVGDRVKARVFGHEVPAEVKAVSGDGVQVAEISRRRGGQRVWINDPADIVGWSDA